MIWGYCFLLAAGCLPLAFAWRACGASSLEHARHWLLAAWAGWGLALILAPTPPTGMDPWRYTALALSTAPVVAVFGARRPYAGAWNFVVLGLLAVLLLPLGEWLILGSSTLDWLRLGFLGVTLAVGVVNYLPTRLAPSVLAAGAFLAAGLVELISPDALPAQWGPWLPLLLLLSPWLGWLSLVWRKPATGIDQMWSSFRDRFGLAWAERVREQFNRSAAHAGWPGHLSWFGWTEPVVGKDDQVRMAETLRALLQRFLDVVA